MRPSGSKYIMRAYVCHKAPTDIRINRLLHPPRVKFVGRSWGLFTGLEALHWTSLPECVKLWHSNNVIQKYVQIQAIFIIFLLALCLSNSRVWSLAPAHGRFYIMSVNTALLYFYSVVFFFIYFCFNCAFFPFYRSWVQLPVSWSLLWRTFNQLL